MSRKFIFQNDHYYHVYNRGVDRRDIFLCSQNFVKFIKSIREFNQKKPIGSFYEKYYLKTWGVEHPIGCSTPRSNKQNKKIIDIISYCLNQNHYHLLIKQLQNNGIPEFMRKLSGGYTNYFNKKYNRSGSLFEGTYKAIEVNNYSHLLKLMVYINCNSEIHNICLAKNWLWSSFLDYAGKRNGTLCNKELILLNNESFLKKGDRKPFVGLRFPLPQ